MDEEDRVRLWLPKRAHEWFKENWETTEKGGEQTCGPKAREDNFFTLRHWKAPWSTAKPKM